MNYISEHNKKLIDQQNHQQELFQQVEDLLNMVKDNYKESTRKVDALEDSKMQQDYFNQVLLGSIKDAKQLFSKRIEE